MTRGNLRKNWKKTARVLGAKTGHRAVLNPIVLGGPRATAGLVVKKIAGEWGRRRLDNS